MRNVVIIAGIFLSLCCVSCSCGKKVADGGKNRADFYCNYAQCRVSYDEMYPKGKVRKIVEKKYKYQGDADTALTVIELGEENKPLRVRHNEWNDSITWTYDEAGKISEVDIVSFEEDCEYIIKYGYDGLRLVRREIYGSVLDAKYYEKVDPRILYNPEFQYRSKFRGNWGLESIDTFIYNKEGLLTEIAVSPILPVEQKKYSLTYDHGFLSKIQNSTSRILFNKEGMETSEEFRDPATLEVEWDAVYIYNKRGKARKTISTPTPQDINGFVGEFLKECKGKKADDETVFVDYLYDEYGNWVVKVTGRESVEVTEREIYYWK